MAWVLRKQGSTDGQKLLANREYVVGRKEVDIILNNDQSISRRHAIFTISHPEGNISSPSNIPVVKLMDTSKYGTSVNGEKIGENGVILKSGHTILFGIFDNHWSVEYKPFICTTSFVEKTERTLVRQYLTKIGGHMVSEWTPQCNLLVMTQLNMSIKVVNALASLCNIVTIEFLKDFINAVEKHSDEPNHKRYIPPLAGPLLREDEGSFIPSGLRKSIFSGFKFFCLSSKQLKKLQLAIKMGDGEACLIESCQKNFPKLLKDESVCILQPSSDELQQESVKTLTNQLEKHSMRYISEAEIGMAILHCSTEKFCNPRGSGEKDFLLQSLESQSLTSQLINLPSANSAMVEYSIDQVKTESCKSDGDSSYVDKQTSLQTLENSTFRKYSANCDPKELCRSVDFNDENISEENHADSHLPPSRLSPDIFGDVSPEDDLSLAPSTSKKQKKTNTCQEEQRRWKGIEDMDCDSENGKLNCHSKHSHITTKSVTEATPSKADQTDVNRKGCQAATNSTPDGFLSSRNLPSIFDKSEEELSNEFEYSRIIIKLEPLIRKRRANQAVSPVSNGHTMKNFKRFKKVLPKCGSANSRVVPFRPTNGLNAVIRDQYSNQANGDLFHSTPSYSQSQSAGLFDWPAHLQN